MFIYIAKWERVSMQIVCKLAIGDCLVQGGEDKVCWHVSEIQWFHANLFFPRRAQVSLEPLGDVRNHHQSYLPTYLLQTGESENCPCCCSWCYSLSHRGWFVISHLNDSFFGAEERRCWETTGKTAKVHSCLGTLSACTQPTHDSLSCYYCNSLLLLLGCGKSP